jgi:hypothetical protein
MSRAWLGLDGFAGNLSSTHQRRFASLGSHRVATRLYLELV